jgi:hypothetical protein
MRDLEAANSGLLPSAFILLPSKVARRLGAAPSPLGFGDPAAQAGARRIRLLHSSFYLLHLKMVRLPGVAPRHTPWRGVILLLNHNREN